MAKSFNENSGRSYMDMIEEAGKAAIKECMPEADLADFDYSKMYDSFYDTKGMFYDRDDYDTETEFDQAKIEGFKGEIKAFLSDYVLVGGGEKALDKYEAEILMDRAATLPLAEGVDFVNKDGYQCNLSFDSSGELGSVNAYLLSINNPYHKGWETTTLGNDYKVALDLIRNEMDKNGPANNIAGWVEVTDRKVSEHHIDDITSAIKDYNSPETATNDIKISTPELTLVVKEGKLAEAIERSEDGKININTGNDAIGRGCSVNVDIDAINNITDMTAGKVLYGNRTSLDMSINRDSGIDTRD